LADVVTECPYAGSVYSDAMKTLAHLVVPGRVAVFSDGDLAYQPSRMSRTGTIEAAVGFALVHIHTAEHQVKNTAALPADHHVLLEDTPDTWTSVGAEPETPGVTSMSVRQGKFAVLVEAEWSGAEIVLGHIGDLRHSDTRALRPSKDRGR
jgi:hypothetical protein